MNVVERLVFMPAVRVVISWALTICFIFAQSRDDIICGSAFYVLFLKGFRFSFSF